MSSRLDQHPESAAAIEERLVGSSAAERLPLLIDLAKALEHENLPRRMQALQEADDLMSADPPVAQRAQVRIERLQGLVMMRGSDDEVESALGRAAADVEALEEPHLEAQLHNIKALIAHKRSESDEARTHLELSASLFRQTGDRERELRVRHNLAHVLHRLGLADETLTQCLQVAELAQATSDQGLKGLAHSALGSAYLSLDRLPEALTEMLRAVDIQDSEGLYRQAIQTRRNLADAWQRAGDLERASEHLRLALEDARVHSEPQLMPDLWRSLSELLRHAGEYEEAVIVATRAAGALGHGDPMLARSLNIELARSYLALAQPELALSQLDLTGAQNHPEQLGETRMILAECLMALGRYDEAQVHLDLVTSDPFRHGLHNATRCTLIAARLALRKGDPERAKEIAESAADTTAAGRQSDLQVQALVLVSEALAASGEFQTAYETRLQLRAVEKEVGTERQRRHVAAMNAAYQVAQAQHEANAERQRSAELASANAELTRLARARNDALGIVAHDLRNPLAGILGSAELLQMTLEAKADRSERLERLATMIIGSAQRMGEDIEALLTTQVVANKELTPTPGGVLVEALVEEVTGVLRHQADAKGIGLKVVGQAGIRVVAERRALREVLDNLVSNAIKFSQEGTQVTVRGSRVGDVVHLSVADQGPGISAEDQGRMYERFATLSAVPTGGERSTGLGLHVVKHLLDAMGASILCTSALGKGTTFTVSLPNHVGLSMTPLSADFRRQQS